MFQISPLMHFFKLPAACYIFSRIVKQVFNLSDLDINAQLSFNSEHWNLSSQPKYHFKVRKIANIWWRNELDNGKFSPAKFHNFG